MTRGYFRAHPRTLLYILVPSCFLIIVQSLFPGIGIDKLSKILTVAYYGPDHDDEAHWDDYLPKFAKGTAVQQCKGSIANSEFELDLEGDPRSDKYRRDPTIDDESHDSIKTIHQCIQDLRDIQNLSSNDSPTFPPAKPDIRIPFYILPDRLPEEARDNLNSTAWSECWAEYQLNTIGSTAYEWIKRTYGYHAARQLENHPWRVANPDDALIYIIPWFDHIKEYIPAREACRPVFDVERAEFAIREAARNYPDHLTEANTLLIMGDHFENFVWFTHSWPTIENIDRSQDYRIRGPAFEPVVSQFMRRPLYFEVRSVEIFNPDVISDQCYRDMHSPSCLQIERTIERDRKLTAAEWKSFRPITFSNFGKIDNRTEYMSRRSFTAALHLLMTNNIVPKISHPFIQIEHAAENWLKNELVSTCSSGVIEKSTDLVSEWRKTIPDYDQYGKPSVVWTVPSRRFNFHTSNKPQIKDLISSNKQADLRTKSRYILSRRGDTPSSQRSYEGFLYGTLTHHDVSEDLFSFYAMLPKHLPYRLSGMWDNQLCIAKLSHQLFKQSGRNAIRFLGSVYHNDHWSEVSFKHYNKPYDEQWSDRDLLAWSKDLIDCHNQFFDLMESEEHEPTFDIMRNAIYAYRDDIIWELPGSRVAENLIFETARLMDRHDPVVLNRFKSESPRHQSWESLNLTRESFEADAIPPSCMLNNGVNSHENGFGKWHKELADIYKKPLDEFYMYNIITFEDELA